MFGGIYRSVILFWTISLQYLNISVIVFSSYKYKVAPLSKVVKNSKILTSKPILVEAKHLSEEVIPPK